MFTYPHFLDTLLIALFMSLLLVAAIHDLTSFRIPNRFSLAIAALYPLHVLTAPVAVNWGGSLAISGIVFAVGFGLFAARLVGGGDVKLLAASSLWAGPGHIFDFLVLTALAGGLLALFLMSPLRWSLALACDRAGLITVRDQLLIEALPYAVAVAIGGIGIALGLTSQ